MKSGTNEWRTLALRLSILFVLVAMVAPQDAEATLYDVTFEADVRTADFSGGGLVFGIAPSDFRFSTTVRIDDAAAPVLAIAAGTQTAFSPLAYDIWGYDLNAISGSPSAGTKTWSGSDPTRLTFRGDVPVSYSWFDMLLSDGATSNRAWLRYEDLDGFMTLGSGVGDGVGRSLDVFDGSTRSRFTARNFLVTAAVVPEPGSAILFGLGLVGLSFARRRSSVRPKA